MSLAGRCLRGFDVQVQARGVQYFREGRVRLGSVINRVLEVTVRGTSGEYAVLLDWSKARDGIVEVDCDCPHFHSGQLCKHLWATILAADAQGFGPPSGKASLSVVAIDADDDDDDEDDDPDWEDEDDDWEDDEDDDDLDGWQGDSSPRTRRRSAPNARPASPFPLRLPGPPPAKRLASWRQQLKPVFDGPGNSLPIAMPLAQIGKVHEAWYVLDVGAFNRNRRPGDPALPPRNQAQRGVRQAQAAGHRPAEYRSVLAA